MIIYRSFCGTLINKEAIMSVFIWQDDAWDKVKEINIYANLADDVKEQEKVFQLYYDFWKENGVTEEQFNALSDEEQKKVKKSAFPPTSEFLIGGRGFYFMVDARGELLWVYDIHSEPSSEQLDLFRQKNKEFDFAMFR